MDTIKNKATILRPVVNQEKMNSIVWNNYEKDFADMHNQIFSETKLLYYIPSKGIPMLRQVLKIVCNLIKDKSSYLILYGSNNVTIIVTILSSLIMRNKLKIIVLEYAFAGDLVGIKYIISKIFINRSSVVGVCSDYEIDRYSKLFKVCNNKFVCIPSPIENDFYRYEGSDDNYILSAGRGYRDYDIIVSVANVLKNHKFVIISDKNCLENLSDIPPNVTILSEISRDLYFEYLKKCSFVVLPVREVHRSAGHQVIYQAMAMGKIVVCSDTITISEIIDNNNGYLFRKNCAASLVEKIDMASKNQNNMNMKKNIILCAEQFSLTRYGDNLRELLKFT